MDNNKEKEREKENIASGATIEEILDTEDIFCAVDIRITYAAIVNALLVVQDSIMQTWIIDSGASFHCTPRESFLSSSTGKFGKVCLGNNHVYNIEGLGFVIVTMKNGQELTLDQVRVVPVIKKSLFLVGQVDLQR